MRKFIIVKEEKTTPVMEIELSKRDISEHEAIQKLQEGIKDITGTKVKVATSVPVDDNLSPIAFRQNTIEVIPENPDFGVTYNATKSRITIYISKIVKSYSFKEVTDFQQMVDAGCPY